LGKIQKIIVADPSCIDINLVSACFTEHYGLMSC
jgi:hypothetical protein